MSHGPTRTPLSASRLARAAEFVDMAWQDLPRPDRVLLESVGAAEYDVVDRPLGAHLPELLASAGARSLTLAERRRLDTALGVWAPDLRLVLIDAGHLALRDLDDGSYEALVVRAAWHEWGHALSLARATPADVADGERLLSLAPPGIAENIRRAGYRRGEYTHEVVAETYALLMARRRRGQAGQPAWLNDEIWALMGRVCGWNR